MNIAELNEQIEIPKGVTVTFNDKILTVQGPKGTLKREINKIISVNIKDDFIVLNVKNVTKKEKKLFFTFKSHINNMIKGVIEGYNYKLKICSGHFPMTVSLKNNIIEVKNFIGESVPRRSKIIDGTEVKINGVIIEVTGIDKEKTGQTAGIIEQLTRRPGFDTRIFQDGIYIIEKNGKKLE